MHKVGENRSTKAKVTAVLGGINEANGKNMIIMNDDFTHPPDILPHMMDLIMKNGEGMVVASRYAEGGSVTGRSLVRKLLGMGAAGIARHGLSVKNVKDPVSGFIAFPKKILAGHRNRRDCIFSFARDPG